MIEILDQSTDCCFAVHFSGKVTGDEYKQFLKLVNERLGPGEPIGLVLVLTGFEFYGDFAAARKDLQFAFGEYKHIHRAAFVGDQKWIEWFTRLLGPFTRTEEKHFPDGQIEAACSWACA
jgi:hypothetical protein